MTDVVRETVRNVIGEMTTISVGSTNPVKIRAVLRGFRRMFPNDIFTVEGCSVESDVAAQPLSDAETLHGAARRAANTRARNGEADYWIGVEGGCEAKFGQVLTFAWIVVLARKWEVIGSGRTGAFCLPGEIADLVLRGVELGEADDKVFGQTNSKRKNGAVGLLTGDVMDRCSYYESAVILALIPFKNPGLRWR
jgi:inosine/xanthosine triphosphatase